MATYLSPLADISFKRLFGTDEHKKLTIDFLNSILGKTPGNLIQQVTFKDTALLPRTSIDKESFVDVHCFDEAGNEYIVEMQAVAQDYFLQRICFYSSLVYSQQLPRGGNYDILLPVIVVCIVNFKQFEHKPAVISRHMMTNLDDNTITHKQIQWYFVELPKFTKTVEECLNSVDQWLFFMTNASTLHAIPENMQQKKQFVEAFDVLNKMRWSDEDYNQYIGDMDKIGEKKRIEGAAIKKEKQDIVMNMFKEDVTVDFIARVTGLPISEIESLKKD